MCIHIYVCINVFMYMPCDDNGAVMRTALIWVGGENCWVDSTALFLQKAPDRSRGVSSDSEDWKRACMLYRPTLETGKVCTCAVAMLNGQRHLHTLPISNAGIYNMHALFPIANAHTPSSLISFSKLKQICLGNFYPKITIFGNVLIIIIIVNNYYNYHFIDNYLINNYFSGWPNRCVSLNGNTGFHIL